LVFHPICCSLHDILVNSVISAGGKEAEGVAEQGVEENIWT